MKKSSSGATQVTFTLTQKEVQKAIISLLDDKYQILGDDTMFKFNLDGGCKIVTMHYELKSKIKEEEIK